MSLRTLKLKTLLLLGLLAFSAVGAAENTAHEHKKAQLVNKLVKNVSWPPESRRLKFTIGVYDNPAFYSTLKAFFSDKKIRSKTITVVNVATPEQASKVNLLYIPYQHRDQLKILAPAIRSNHILLVSENNSDVENMMVNLTYNNEESDITFEVNEANTKAEKLSLSSRLNFVAAKVVTEKEKTTPVPEIKAPQTKSATASSEQTLLEKQLTLLNQKVLTQEKNLKTLTQQFSESKKSINKNNVTSKKQISQLNKQQQQLNDQKQRIADKEKELSALTKQLKLKQQNKQKKLKTNNEQQLQSAEKLEQQAQQITTLNDQLTQLEQQKTALNNQAIKQAKMLKATSKDTNVGSLFYLTLVIALIALLLAGFLWLRNKKAGLALNQASATLTQREKQLFKSEQVASLGYVASDITYAAGSALDDVYQQGTQAKKPINGELLKPIVALLENFNQIAADQDEEEKKRFDLVAYINKIMMLFAVEFKHSNINYSYSGDKKLLIESIPSQITLLILNLVNNSLKHAFADNKAGKILINIENTKKGKTKITFQDDGAGMKQSTVAQAFSPFFTTKGERGYVGIGLSTSHDIVKNKLSGDITLTSQPKKGTTVTITL